MTIHSYNSRVLASMPKKIALKELMKLHTPDVLFIQETLGQGEEVLDTLTKMFPGWVSIPWTLKEDQGEFFRATIQQN